MDLKITHVLIPIMLVLHCCDVISACNTDPDCLNGGTCVFQPAGFKACVCATQYAGSTCQLGCSPVCEHNGECKESGGAAYCDCSGNSYAGASCELGCPTCSGSDNCRETPAGKASECASPCTNAASCTNQGSCGTDQTCACNANRAGYDCGLECAPSCDSTKEICQKGSDGSAQCVVDCHKTDPCGSGGVCVNGVCTSCAGDKVGKFCQYECSPPCGQSCKLNAAGDGASCPPSNDGGTNPAAPKAPKAPQSGAARTTAPLGLLAVTVYVVLCLY